MNKSLIVVTGNSATGTTTLTKKISEKFGFEALFSEMFLKNSPFFGKFLSEPSKWAFHNQIFFVIEYLEGVLQFSNHSSCIVFDFMFDELEIYSEAQFRLGYLNTDEYELILKFISHTKKNISEPNFVVFLHSSPNIVLERIKSRNRAFEDKIDFNYVSMLDNLFRAKYESISLPKIEINSEKYNFNLEEDLALVLQKVKINSPQHCIGKSGAEVLN